MAIGLLLPLRIVQAVFCIIVLSLSSYIAHWYTYETLSFSPSQVNFLVFTPLFSLFSIAYLELAPRFFPRFSHPYAHLAIEGVNCLFYFSGFIALSVFISSLLFCRGTVCSTARADVAFASFSFFAWIASTGLLAISLFKGGMGQKNNNPNVRGDEKLPVQMEDTVGSRASESA